MRRLLFRIWNYSAGNICRLGHTSHFDGPAWWCEWRSARWWKRHGVCNEHLGGDS